MRRAIPSQIPPMTPTASSKRDVSTALKNAQLVVEPKPVLPLEIIAAIIDHLPVSDLMRISRVSKRFQEMVYDDTRWVHKLRLIGVWNELEARRRLDDAMRRKRAIQEAKALVEGKAVPSKDKSMIFDAAEEERRRAAAAKLLKDEEARMRAVGVSGPADLVDGLQLLSVQAGEVLDISTAAFITAEEALVVLDRVRSIRGLARYEFARIYGALGRLYHDLVRARTHNDPVLFKRFRDPQEQAKMLNQLKRFSESDTAYGWMERQERLQSMMGIFENAALAEFEKGYEAKEYEGRMKRYADVLITLNGGQACVQLFVQKHPIMFEREQLGNPMDCFRTGSFSITPVTEFFTKVSAILNEQADVIDQVFPPTTEVYEPFLERIAEDVIAEYITPLLDEARDRATEQYLKAMAGIWIHCEQFVEGLRPPKSAGEDFKEKSTKSISHVFDAHVDLYLQDELDFFKQKAEDEVKSWEKKINEEDAAAESFYMSNVNREADKKDFLTSFKKVMLLPVSVIPLPSFGRTSTPSQPAHVTTPSRMGEETGYFGSIDANATSADATSTPQSGENRMSITAPPTTELAAKAAIMNSRLDNIRSLFSLEVALNLVHSAKSSLERAALFTKLGGQTGEEAKEQCEAIFVSLLQILGSRHVHTGFNKAIDHLSHYNPRTAPADAHGQASGVAPLTTFLELVNVGDLIQQMVDVFYEEELVGKRLTDRNDFVSPAVVEKRKFEKMLDERVATGLNRGIDVLMEEVDYIFATTQQLADFNPGLLNPMENTTNKRNTIGAGFSNFANAASFGLAGTSSSQAGNRNSDMPRDFDIGPTPTAVQVVKLVETHTKMLAGSTDKNVLDVFYQEVGLRLFASVGKHIKRQRISVDGAIKLISDVNLYNSFITTMKIRSLVPHFNALRELAQIYLIDAKHAKQMASVIADQNRFGGIFRVEEVYEYAARREDWYVVKKDVDKALYGFGCALM
ncbi:hypothetical protein BJ508DRAFT_417674 [Ascobolus immersus RN42]|uniref:F-box domain-containing protein n=1 Tax=Ascobolus immersus RN42 TaxID=1160509 RepID=A0A3N4HSG0_ASCIM|nr:hypothetical protein BJ508DRAFT_417674 [Ascobolus immersus RN42]